jgi:hydroxymethylbilane synthase
MQSLPVRIGTRGSPLALRQAEMVAAALARAHGLEPGDLHVMPIRTTGDAAGDRPLAEIGGKGLFTKEIEQALAEGAIDLAVHSLKDMATVLPAGLAIGAVLERGDVRDALIGPGLGGLDDLPPAPTVGTSSLRRAALVRALRPGARIVALRGNVESRLRKLADGAADATLLAMAGLERLGLIGRAGIAAVPLDPAAFLPAPAQGAIAVEIRAGDGAAGDLLALIDHGPSRAEITAERAFLAVLDGSCRTPIAGLARHRGGRLVFDGLIVKPDGSLIHRARREGEAGEAALLGAEAGAELKALGGPDFFAG